jgi:hypothetical protein
LTYEEARLACRSDGGELLSIETESEQRLVERFIQQLKVGEGDYWIGLRRNPQRSRPAGASPPACPFTCLSFCLCVTSGCLSGPEDLMLAVT